MRISHYNCRELDIWNFLAAWGITHHGTYRLGLTVCLLGHHSNHIQEKKLSWELFSI